jgi:hypothetical protein
MLPTQVSSGGRRAASATESAITARREPCIRILVVTGFQVAGKRASERSGLLELLLGNVMNRNLASWM